MIEHMTPEELAKIATVELRLAASAGETHAIEVIKQCVIEIKACWFEMESKKGDLSKFKELLEPPKENLQLKNGARMWYE